jgi:chromosome segregation ATPase
VTSCLDTNTCAAAICWQHHSFRALQENTDLKKNAERSTADAKKQLQQEVSKLQNRLDDSQRACTKLEKEKESLNAAREQADATAAEQKAAFVAAKAELEGSAKRQACLKEQLRVCLPIIAELREANNQTKKDLDHLKELFNADVDAMSEVLCTHDQEAADREKLFEEDYAQQAAEMHAQQQRLEREVLFTSSCPDDSCIVM